MNRRRGQSLIVDGMTVNSELIPPSINSTCLVSSGNRKVEKSTCTVTAFIKHVNYGLSGLTVLHSK
jgi:hypothetical protein